MIPSAGVRLGHALVRVASCATRIGLYQSNVHRKSNRAVQAASSNWA
jgi:hypothetical protein